MTYLISTCRKTTAVLGSVYGNFDGSGEYHHLVLNCATRLEVWEISVADLERLPSRPQTTPTTLLPSTAAASQTPRLLKELLPLLTTQRPLPLATYSRPARRDSPRAS